MRCREAGDHVTSISEYPVPHRVEERATRGNRRSLHDLPGRSPGDDDASIGCHADGPARPALEHGSDARPPELDDVPNPGVEQGAPQDAFDERRAGERRRPPRQQERQLRIGVELRQRRSGKRPRVCRAGLRSRRAALAEREHRDRRHHDDREQRRQCNRNEVATVAPRCQPLMLEVAAAPPAEDRAGEHVVKDLEANPGARPLVERPQDPLPP